MDYRRLHVDWEIQQAHRGAPSSPCRVGRLMRGQSHLEQLPTVKRIADLDPETIDRGIIALWYAHPL